MVMASGENKHWIFAMQYVNLKTYNGPYIPNRKLTKMPKTMSKIATPSCETSLKSIYKIPTNGINNKFSGWIKNCEN